MKINIMSEHNSTTSRDKSAITIAKLLKGKPSPRKRIAAMCCECIYDPESMGAGTWRQQVQDCTSTQCPLYPERPALTPRKQLSEAESNED